MVNNVLDLRPLGLNDAKSPDLVVIESNASVKQNISTESSKQETITNESVPPMKTDMKEDIKNTNKAPSTCGAMSKNMESKEEQSSDVDTKDKEGRDSIQEDTENLESQHDASTRRMSSGVETYAIQCNTCFKWRIIPTKEKYEAIGEHILERPFVCITAQEWRKGITCNDVADLDENNPSVLWAIDKHNIPCPPQGFYRKVVLRAENAKKFADIYYKTPCGKTLRSNVQVQKYLDEHPELNANVSQFSFTSPKGKAEAMGASKRPSKDETQINNDVRKRSKGSILNPEPLRTKAPVQGPRPRSLAGNGTAVKSESVSVAKPNTMRQDKSSLEKAHSSKSAHRSMMLAVKREKLEIDRGAR